MSKAIYYTKRKQRYQMFLNKLEQSFNRFVLLKFIIIITGLAGTVFCLIIRRFPIAGGLFLLGIVLLIYLDIGHSKVIFFQKQATILRDINEHSIWRLDGRWTAFEDTGSEFQNEEHPYAADLDIFGKGSLFQWINVTRTFWGREKLRNLLTSSPEPVLIIRERQAAIMELADSLSWRQRFLTNGTTVADKMRDPAFLLKWVNDRNSFLLKSWVRLSLRFLPVITIGIIIYYFTTKSIPLLIPLLALLIHFGLLKVGGKKRNITLATVGEYERNLQVYADLLRQILKRNYQSPHLKELKQKLYNRYQESASQQLKKLTKLVDMIANRSNAIYGLVNLIILWDYQFMITLESWKEASGSALQDWLETIAEFEALSSLAIIRYDHPDWTIPEFIIGTPTVTAAKLGHPLLIDTVRVPNDLQIGAQTNVLLITGSNMSGKSTYLRTAGINLVLAYTGAPVCAKSFRCTILDIYTCMRISDNLEKNISTFYAEILRIKSIVEASSGPRPVFFLLDEIFKGTNSLDRHTGAKILIKKLIENKAIGLVSTHDLELGELAKEQTTVKNSHFQEHFKNNQLSFDYQLRPGISRTRNAMYLMKAAGIVEDEVS